MELRYGMNPHQPAKIAPLQPGRTPFRVVHGEPSYINVLDALGAWQLVREASSCFGRPAATSFKHVSPAGAALAGEVDAGMRSTYDLGDVGAVTSAYVRARDADPKSSYGDFVAVSHPVDAELAAFLQRLACDGIIAPAYDAGVVGALAGKKRRTFLVLEGDPAFEPPAEEVREVYGLRLTQQRDDLPLNRSLFDGQSRADDLLLGMIVLRYTQSNSVAFLKDGMALGIGAGQQSRIDCTQLAGHKAQTWWLRRHPEVLADSCQPGAKLSDRIARQLALVETFRPTEGEAWLSRLTGLSMVSDGAIPFRDNIDVAHGYGVRSIAEPGGSVRSTEIVQACKDNGIALTQTGIRLFCH